MYKTKLIPGSEIKLKWSKGTATTIEKCEAKKRYTLLKEEQIQQQIKFEVEKHPAEMEILRLQRSTATIVEEILYIFSTCVVHIPCVFYL